jgi:hypothetical protein
VSTEDGATRGRSIAQISASILQAEDANGAANNATSIVICAGDAGLLSITVKPRVERIAPPEVDTIIERLLQRVTARICAVHLPDCGMHRSMASRYLEHLFAAIEDEGCLIVRKRDL